jgi:hypothetical protein
VHHLVGLVHVHSIEYLHFGEGVDQVEAAEDYLEEVGMVEVERRLEEARGLEEEAEPQEVVAVVDWPRALEMVAVAARALGSIFFCWPDVEAC